MGLATFFAKFGAPGSTAKSVANGYKKIKEACPGITDKDIFKKIIEVRYSGMNEKHYFDSINEMIDNDQIENTCQLVMSVISHESQDFKDLPLKAQFDIINAVKDILYKENVL